MFDYANVAVHYSKSTFAPIGKARFLPGDRPAMPTLIRNFSFIWSAVKSLFRCHRYKMARILNFKLPPLERMGKFWKVNLRVDLPLGTPLDLANPFQGLGLQAFYTYLVSKGFVHLVSRKFAIF